MKKKIKLDRYEQELEANLENCQKITNEKLFKKQLEAAAKKYLSSKTPITIEVSEHDLETMKIKASKLGIPYKSYINILIHKDASSL